jgi:DNA polymerase-1
LKLAFDIEANGLLDTVTKVHCICAVDLETDNVYNFGPDQLHEAKELLEKADFLVGHNIIGYDLPVVRQVLDCWPTGTVIDTLVTARLIHSNLKETDHNLVVAGRLDKDLYGSNSLKAWGQRIGIKKDEYEGGFEEFNEEMYTYCQQDVQVLKALWHYLKPQGYSEPAIALENDIADVCFRMEQHGWTFDSKKAIDLYSTLAARREELTTALIAKFGTWQEVDKVLVPKKDNKARGYIKGVPVTKYKTIEFNPNSRQHIEKKLREMGWKPDVFTESGQAKLDESTLSKIDIPEAKLLVEHFLIEKRLGQLADGDAGWLKMVGKDGRIHGRYNTMGTVTGRASHYSPNIAQVPAGKSPYGKECRDLFTVPVGWRLVGADMAGLELRCLAHYLHAYDGGSYGDLVLNGDVHTENQKAAGLPTRDNAKTFIYAFLYGAGPSKIGKIVNGSAKQGSELITRFMRGLPAFGKLKQAVSTAAQKGWLKGLDGRRIPVRSEHAALNSLLQGCGAILCKRWVVDAHKSLSSQFSEGYDGDFVFCGWIHDEVQVACREEIAEQVGEIITDCARKAGIPYGFKIKLDSEYIIGRSWADTH